VVSAFGGQTGFDEGCAAKRGPIQFLPSWQRIYSEIEREIFAGGSMNWRSPGIMVSVERLHVTWWRVCSSGASSTRRKAVAGLRRH
jgi:hypothetical protein